MVVLNVVSERSRHGGCSRGFVVVMDEALTGDVNYISVGVGVVLVGNGSGCWWLCQVHHKGAVSDSNAALVPVSCRVDTDIRPKMSVIGVHVLASVSFLVCQFEGFCLPIASFNDDCKNAILVGNYLRWEPVSPQQRHGSSVVEVYRIVEEVAFTIRAVKCSLEWLFRLQDVVSEAQELQTRVHRSRAEADGEPDGLSNNVEPVDDFKPTEELEGETKLCETLATTRSAIVLL
ncbi:hypothetical protein TEA_004169 [Camellia sinensis var. sinensis]|uniref:Uncharacterized protein n=1 Tax=Camellia sinensis var. sinensis TaxID=542762 RepID=A0A4S4E382_CAMSN|nr:hypothetical protein TEA_004169 [Camellia sinensis var. sinensis]